MKLLSTSTLTKKRLPDALISELGTIGYDGFSYTDQGFTAYIPAKDYDAQAITRLEVFDFFTRNYRIETSVQEIEDQDWNKVWEENFTPITVDDRILVRAGFHDPVPGIEYEILIEPKMSFGTGHHSTTALMLRTILDNKDPDQRQTGTRYGMRNRHPVYHGRKNRSPGNHRHRHRRMGF